MTYKEWEESDEGGEPVELYEIQVGSEVPTYKYTSSEEGVTIASFDYVPEAIKRAEAKSGARERNDEFKVELPAANPFCLRYAGAIPGARVKLIVSRYHRPDGATPEVQEVFYGFVESVSVTGNMHNAELTARSTLAALSHTIPREGYQTQCNNVLYRARCGVDDTDPQFRVLNGIVDAVDGRVLYMSQASKFPDGWFAAGRCTIDSGQDQRMILRHEGDEIEVSVPFPVDPTLATIYAGCAHKLTVCVDKFDNGINFRGWHAVPNRNPYSDGVL